MSGIEEALIFTVQQDRFLAETSTAVFLYLLQDGEVYAMNSFPHLQKLGFLLDAEEIGTSHIHEFTEIILLVKGQLIHDINGVRRRLPPGALVFVRPYDLHRLLPVDAERTVFASLVLTASVIHDLMSYLCNPAITHRFNTAPEAPCLHLPPDEARDFMLEMEKVSNEQAVAPQNSMLMARVLAARLFARLLLPAGTGAARDDKPLPPMWLERLREKAEQWDSLVHATSRLHAICRCHPSHLCKCFRHYYDETPTDFINRLRLRQAVRRLKDPEAKVAAIAAELGFDSLSHFHRLFKRQYGITPAAFRKACIDLSGRRPVAEPMS
ncbi:MAG TPA: AraC family transcriptional regulator [Kiritimatiellia bacterium]|nr:AraC family transcriptional regulator [Kiritimatiellia bacterium]HRU71755.1 AraC family transcriptional regulator [Kiritimatiellia bacterium]